MEPLVVKRQKKYLTMNCHGGCARNAGLKQAIDRVPKRKVIDPKADPRLMGAPGTPARRR